MGQIPKLLTFDQAALALNVPMESLRSVADAHGKTIHMGRAIRIDEDDLKELVKLCQRKPKVPASSGRTDPQKDGTVSGSSETEPPASHVALRNAKELKKSLRRT
jgi:hypothetical protein